MFQGNETLRGKGEEIAMTEDELLEYAKCASDVFHFAKYFCITAADGVHPIELRPYQERLLHCMVGHYPEKNNRIIMMGRQTGKTTLATLVITWYALFHKAKRVAILANKESQAIEIMNRVRLGYNKLPMWLQQGCVSWSKGAFELENETKVFCAASSSSAIRGQSIDFCLVDEFAHIDNNLAEDFMLSVFPAMSSRGFDATLMLISTPKGMNHFYDIWRDACQGRNSFVPAKVQWYEVEGRTEEWKEKQIRDNGIKFFNQEYACVDGSTEIEILTAENEQKRVKIEDLYEMCGY